MLNIKMLPFIVLLGCHFGCISQEAKCLQTIKKEKFRGIELKQYIKSLLPENPIVLEAGASYGSDTVQMARLIKGSKIFAFEPAPYLFQKLIKNTIGLENVKCFNMALSNDSGKFSFYQCNANGGYGSGAGSLLKPSDLLLHNPRLNFDKVIEVEVLTLDQWAEKEGISHIDFMWLDMQGHEADMLMASHNIIKSVKVIYTEVLYKQLYEGAILYPRFRSWMEEQGFVVVQEVEGGPGWGDVLFVRG